MPLFNNWPSVDLSKLNLDWIIMKIRHVEDAEADAEKVIEAAATILPKVDQVNADAARAEAAADRAENAADRADVAVTVAASSAQNAQNSAEAAATNATDAEHSAIEASNYKNSAETASSDASRFQNFAVQARIAAEAAQAAAEAAAARAESASSTTGYRAFTGVIQPSVIKTLEVPDGTYLLTWFANDQENSSAIYLMFKDGVSLTYRNVNYIGDGDTGFLINSTETAITIRSQLSVPAYWFITGCEAF